MRDKLLLKMKTKMKMNMKMNRMLPSQGAREQVAIVLLPLSVPLVHTRNSTPQGSQPKVDVMCQQVHVEVVMGDDEHTCSEIRSAAAMTNGLVVRP